MVQPTFKRYSTARSGLKNAALIARSISALGNPILSIFATAAARAAPSARVEGSLKCASFVVAAPVVRAAGEGVDGMFAGASDVGAGTGAAGMAGV